MHFAEPGILLILGIAVSGGILSAVIVKRLSIPQVLGYLVMGIIIGESGFKLVTRADIETLSPLNFFALGVIGFLVGSEIRFETFKKYGRQFSCIFCSGISPRRSPQESYSALSPLPPILHPPSTFSGSIVRQAF